jgi:hypothetical protein
MRYIGTCVLTLLPLGLMVRKFVLQERWNDVWELVGVYMVLWLGLIGVMGLFLAATETLVLSHDRLIFMRAYAGIPYRRKEYGIKYIQRPRAGRLPGIIEFTYGDREVERRTNLANGERRIFLQLLTAILSYPYHAVETLVFGGEFAVKDDVSTVIQNPESADFTLPLFRLKQILVYPKSASFLLLERFLTYAVNALGPQELKCAVNVHVYGDAELLPSHLRNSLTHLFHMVSFYDEADMFPGIQEVIVQEKGESL